jgi:hypothetical protein
MQLIHAFFLPMSENPVRRKAPGGVLTGAIKALLLPIPIVAVVFAVVVAWLNP